MGAEKNPSKTDGSQKANGPPGSSRTDPLTASEPRRVIGDGDEYGHSWCMPATARLNRRELAALLPSAFLSWSNTARAQAPAPLRKVGILIGLPQTDEEVAKRSTAFREAMAQFGWAEGRNRPLRGAQRRRCCRYSISGQSACAAQTRRDPDPCDACDERSSARGRRNSNCVRERSRSRRQSVR